MKHFVSLSALLVLIGSPVRLETSATLQTSAAQTAATRHQELVKTYCVTCHSIRAKMGGLALEGLNLQYAADNAEIWEKALRKLRGNQMPRGRGGVGGLVDAATAAEIRALLRAAVSKK
jgi:mono/diheme cytochrome c family protein